MAPKRNKPHFFNGLLNMPTTSVGIAPARKLESPIVPPFTYELLHVDAGCAARRGRFHTPHGPIEMPAFMPVGTLASVKGLEVDQIRATGTQIVLGNTYHLALRPGEKVVQRLGGLHPFMGWDGPILTDSGGFQLFSLAKMTKVTEEQAVFSFAH